MKALILGGSGQVGRALAATAPLGTQAVAFGRDRCDIVDRDAVFAVVDAERPDILFNAAAYTAVDEAEAEPDRAALVNAAAPGWVAEAGRAAGARTIHVSTDFVFDGLSGRPYRADSATNPLSVYGCTKRDGERELLTADPNALVVRTAWVYAAAGRNFVRTMLRLMAERERLAIVADQIGTPTWASSLASSLWRLAASGASGTHHFTDAGVASWYDFAIAIKEEAISANLLDRAAEVVPVRSEDHPTRARRPAYSVLDKADTWAVLDTPPRHWRVNLRTCLQEIVRNG